MGPGLIPLLLVVYAVLAVLRSPVFGTLGRVPGAPVPAARDSDLQVSVAEDFRGAFGCLDLLAEEGRASPWRVNGTIGTCARAAAQEPLGALVM